MIGYDFSFTKKITYECDKGYILKGPAYRNCQANEEWSGTPPTCEGTQSVVLIKTFFNLHICTCTMLHLLLTYSYTLDSRGYKTYYDIFQIGSTSYTTNIVLLLLYKILTLRQLTQQVCIATTPRVTMPVKQINQYQVMISCCHKAEVIHFSLNKELSFLCEPMFRSTSYFQSILAIKNTAY